MKKNFLAYGIVFLSLCCIIDLNLRWSALVFTAIAILLFWQQRDEKTPLPPVSLLLLANVLGYPIVAVVPDMYDELRQGLNPYMIEFALLWAVRGFAAFACAYVAADAFARRFHQQRHLGWKDAEKLAYARYICHAMGIFSITAWVAKEHFFGFGLTFITGRATFDITSAESSFAQVLELLINLRNPFFFMLGVMHLRRLDDRFMRLLAVGIGGGILFEIVTIGSKGAIIFWLVLAALVIACTVQRLSLKQLFIGGFMLLTVYMSFLTITEYRDIMHDRNRRGEDVFDISVQAESFSEAFLASLPFSEKRAQRRTTVSEQDILSRISSGLFSFGHILYFTGGHPPYEHAWEAFLIPLYSIAPRALLDKPVFFNAGRFGLEYFHTSTAISVSTLGAFYHAWGYIGIVTGMALIGGMTAFLIRRVLSRTTALNSAVFMVTTIMSLVNVGSSFWGVVVELCRLAVILSGLYMLYPVVKRIRHGHQAETMLVVYRAEDGL
ncbi:MAG: hypothetical protein LBU39_00410 [Desulfobulbaceae bacterium]|nr:hypothetical protein [Desulfobulbaceae bacterium]